MGDISKTQRAIHCTKIHLTMHTHINMVHPCLQPVLATTITKRQTQPYILLIRTLSILRMPFCVISTIVQTNVYLWLNV